VEKKSGNIMTLEEHIKKVITEAIGEVTISVVPEKDEYLGTVKEVAKHLSKSEKWVYERLKDEYSPLPYFNGVYVSELKKWWRKRAGVS